MNLNYNIEFCLGNSKWHQFKQRYSFLSRMFVQHVTFLSSVCRVLDQHRGGARSVLFRSCVSAFAYAERTQRYSTKRRGTQTRSESQQALPGYVYCKYKRLWTSGTLAFPLVQHARRAVTSGARRLPSLGFQLNFCAGMQSADRPRRIT